MAEFGSWFTRNRHRAALNRAEDFLFGREGKRADIKFAEFIAKDSFIEACMDKGPEKHISANSGEAVGVGDTGR
jgi:hypothetical protein